MNLAKLLLAVILAVLAIGFFITYSVALQQVEHSSIKLFKGWNLISITQPMAGKSLATMNTMVPRCEDWIDEVPTTLVPAWTFDNTAKQWLLVQNFGGTIPLGMVDIVNFNGSNTGMGLWINVRNECVLGCGITACS